MFELIVVRGADVGRRFPLTQSESILGRQSGHEIVLDDQQLSRRHARLSLRNGAVFLSDLGSANGTRINGRPVTVDTALKIGDLIALGNTELRVEWRASDEAVGSILPGASLGQRGALPRRRLPLVLGASVGAILVLCVCLAAALFVISRGDSGQAVSTVVSTGNNGAAPRAGYVVGKVIDTAGNPIQSGDVSVEIFGTSSAGNRSSYTAHPGADGTYALRVPDGVYRVQAYVEVTFNGRPYSFPLDPLDGRPSDSHESARGIVKDFRWKIAGPRPGTTDQSARSFYGGSISIADGYFTEPSKWLEKRYPGAQVEVTFIPRGPLVDGSNGQRLVKVVGVAGSLNGNAEILDLPIGPYTVSARLILADGTARPLQVALGTSSTAIFGSSVVLDFPPNEAGSKPFGVRKVELGIKE